MLNKVSLLNYFINVFYEKKLIQEKEIELKIKKICSFLKIDIFPFQKINPFKVEMNIHLAKINEFKKIFLNSGLSEHAANNYVNFILGALIPTNETINHMWSKQDLSKLYEMSLLTYYIKNDKKAIIWNFDSPKYGQLKVTINKSKPEKTQAQILAESKITSTSGKEPLCNICLENINFHGSTTKPSKENLRVLYIDIANKNWFLQYSPYAYLENHFIYVDPKHEKMLITRSTFEQLIGFVKAMPKFFLGSNSDLPIIGGSLLGHNHYQGGSELLPIFNAKTFKKYHVNEEVDISLLNWPLAAMKITSKNADVLIDYGEKVKSIWEKYFSNAITNENNNSLTIIARQNINNILELFIVFRNNHTTKNRPFGEYHIKEKRFNVKKENIGLIEAAGMAVLPARLESEMKQLLHFIQTNKVQLIEKKSALFKHVKWAEQFNLNQPNVTLNDLKVGIAKTFVKCLRDCHVFNNNNEKFMKFFEKNLLF